MAKSIKSEENKHSLRQTIIKTAASLFLTKGIKSVKMDDISNALSISKRTLYEVFDNKEELVLASVQYLHSESDKHMEKFCKKEPSVIEILLEFYKYEMERLTNVSPNFYTDLERYPDALKWLKKSKKENEKYANEFFRRGVDEGSFRQDVDYELIGEICDGSMEYALSHSLTKHYSLRQIFRNVIMLYIRGFCTKKGIEELEKLQ